MNISDYFYTFNWKRQYLLWNVNNMQIFNFHFVKSHNGPALVLQIILASFWGFWCSFWLYKSLDLSKRTHRGPLRILTFILDPPKQLIVRSHRLQKNVLGHNLMLCPIISMTNPLIFVTFSQTSWILVVASLSNHLWVFVTWT